MKRPLDNGLKSQEEMRELFKRTGMLPPEDLTLPGLERKPTKAQEAAAAKRWSDWFITEVRKAARELYWKKRGSTKNERQSMKPDVLMIVNSNGTSEAVPLEQAQNTPPKKVTKRQAKATRPAPARPAKRAHTAQEKAAQERRDRIRAEVTQDLEEMRAQVRREVAEERRVVRSIMTGAPGESVLDK